MAAEIIAFPKTCDVPRPVTPSTVQPRTVPRAKGSQTKTASARVLPSPGGRVKKAVKCLFMGAWLVLFMAWPLVYAAFYIDLAWHAILFFYFIADPAKSMGWVFVGHFSAFLLTVVFKNVGGLLIGR